MRQESSFFDGTEAKLVYIASKLNDALAVETLLTEAGFDYGVEADRYRGGVIFPSERVGAFFYVLPETERGARALLEQRGWKTALPELPPAG